MKTADEDNKPRQTESNWGSIVQPTLESQPKPYFQTSQTPQEAISDCEHCIKAKGVHQHRRKTDKGLATEVAADFMFLSCVGERISIEESGSPT